MDKSRCDKKIPKPMPKAMILAAGKGTRLLPLTNSQPKALVPLAGKPLIEHVLERFKKFNFNDIVINLHHYGDHLQAVLASEKFKDFKISFSDESAQLLDTGGGIRKAAWFLNDLRPFLVHNCDVISLIPLAKMLRFHVYSKALATLAVSARKTSRPLAFNTDGTLIGRWTKTTDPASRLLAFSGVYILDPAIFSYMPKHDVFSIIDVLILASNQRPVMAFEHSPEIWVDAGSIENFAKAEKLLKKPTFEHGKIISALS